MVTRSPFCLLLSVGIGLVANLGWHLGLNKVDPPLLGQFFVLPIALGPRDDFEVFRLQILGRQVVVGIDPHHGQIVKGSEPTVVAVQVLQHGNGSHVQSLPMPIAVKPETTRAKDELAVLHFQIVILGRVVPFAKRVLDGPLEIPHHGINGGLSHDSRFAVDHDQLRSGLVVVFQDMIDQKLGLLE